jgi:Ca2+-binding RTX toxin-like protein
MATGTNRNDTLNATARGELLFGRAGNDTITSLFNKTKLYGETGHDRLTVDLDRSGPSVPVTLFSTLSGGFGSDTLKLEYAGDSGRFTTMQADLDGGAGNDTLDLQYAGSSDGDVTMEADLDGGAGNDTISVAVSGYGSVVTSEIRVRGGEGDDRMDAFSDCYGSAWTYETGDEWSAKVTQWIDGGAGNDTINALAIALNGDVDYSTNFIFGGEGDDTIYAKTNDVEFAAGMSPYTTNQVDGGSGNDYIEAHARLDGNGAEHSLNIIQGGTGKDTIVARATANSNDAPMISENRVDGGAGDDSITVFTGAGFGHGTLLANVLGGSGNDAILATANGGSFGINAKLAFDGGVGNDRIDSTVTADGYDNPFGPDRINNLLQGNEGDDTLVARIETRAADENYTPNIRAVNRLDGEAGADVMHATVVNTGRSILHGGSGADTLRVSGGQSNLLSGGSGADRFFAGSGTDRMIGGGRADDFVFDVARDQGADRILDFDGDLDRLCFVGLTDRGAAGLADDLDAITSVVDQGAGLDVVVSFDQGTALTFEGCGLGSDFMGDPLIDSLADLVANAATQLRVELL